MEVGEWCRGGYWGSCWFGLLSELGVGGIVDVGSCLCGWWGLGVFGEER